MRMFPLPAVFLRPCVRIGSIGAADQYILRNGGRIDFQNAVRQKHRDDLFLSRQRISGNARNALHDLHILGNRGQRQNCFRAIGAVHHSVNGLIESSAEILQFRQAVAIPEGHGLVILQTGRQRNGGKPPALGKRLHPNVFQPGWQRNTGQILAALEHLFFNAGQAFRQLHRFQIDAVPERTPIQTGNAFRNHNAGDPCISVKESHRDFRNAFRKFDISGNGGQHGHDLGLIRTVHNSVYGFQEFSAQVLQVRQAGAAAECPRLQPFQGSGKRYRIQASAVPKGAHFNTLQSFRQGDFSQASAVLERIAFNCFQTGRQRNVRQFLASAEGTPRQTFQCFRQNNRLKVTAVGKGKPFKLCHAVRQGDAGDRLIAVEGVGTDRHHWLAAQHRRELHVSIFAGVAGDGRAGIVRSKGEVLFPQCGDVLLRREHLAAFGAVAALGLAWLGVGGFHRGLGHDGMHVWGQKSIASIRKCTCRFCSGSTIEFGEFPCSSFTKALFSNLSQLIPEIDFLQIVQIRKSAIQQILKIRRQNDCLKTVGIAGRTIERIRRDPVDPVILQLQFRQASCIAHQRRACVRSNIQLAGRLLLQKIYGI